MGAFEICPDNNRRSIYSLRNFHMGGLYERFSDRRNGSVVNFSLHNRRTQNSDNFAFCFAAVADLRRVVVFDRRHRFRDIYDYLNPYCNVAFQKKENNIKKKPDIKVSGFFIV